MKKHIEVEQIETVKKLSKSKILSMPICIQMDIHIYIYVYTCVFHPPKDPTSIALRRGPICREGFPLSSLPELLH